MTSPNKKIVWKKNSLGYIDNKRKYTNDWLINNLQYITQKIQHATQSWKHLLFTSNGKLEITKYDFNAIEW